MAKESREPAGCKGHGKQFDKQSKANQTPLEAVTLAEDSSDIWSTLLEMKEQLDRIESVVCCPDNRRTAKKWFTTAEAARQLKRRPFTVREWCRLGRINAEKRPCGRGGNQQWKISADEIQRIDNEGLLPELIPKFGIPESRADIANRRSNGVLR
jgi:hypothetical protein